MAAKFIILFTAFWFFGCGLQKPMEETPSSEPQDARERVDAKTLDGRAQWLFLKPLKGISSSEHFIIEAQLTLEQANVTLHSHFNGFKWRDGVMVRLLRDEGKIFIEISTPGLTARRKELPPELVSRDGYLKVRIEIHDGVTSGARVLLWRYNASEQGVLESPRRFISAANADFDSAREDWFFSSQGRGAQWGIELEGATLTGAYREAPYVD